MIDIQQILTCLNKNQIRATYGAVGKVMGIPAIGVGRHLGELRAEASWIVSASSGKPSGYDQSDYHEALFSKQEIIKDGHELLELLGDRIQDTHVQPKPSTRTSATPLKSRQSPISRVISHNSTETGYRVAGIDLAWSTEKNGSGIAIGLLSDKQVILEELHCGVIGLNNVTDILDHTQKLQGVAVDAPLIIENKKGARPCEEALNEVYRARWAGCYPSNQSLFPDASSVKLSKWLESRRMPHLGAGNESGWQIECYPHPAIIELFGLKKRHKYKKGTLEEKQQGQIELAHYIQSLGSSSTLSLRIPDAFSAFLDSGHIQKLSGQGLKHNEDALDALICLYIAGLYAIGKEMVIFGDSEEGYIVVPAYC
jgi:predicted RNase H-like nuclease